MADAKRPERKDGAKAPRGVIHDEQLEAARNRLYSRTRPPATSARPSFTRTTQPTIRKELDIRSFEDTKQQSHIAKNSTSDTEDAQSADVAMAPLSDMATKPQRTKRNGYRIRVVVVALVFFVAALIFSSAFLFFGQNTISGNNIAIEVTAPFAVGGGEELNLMIAVTNHNGVSVEAATLVIEYPPGTQSSDGSNKEIFRDRVSLGDIDPGEVLNVPMKARIFGEENDEKIIAISVEYRVSGSNATFFKEADPVRLKISSSPVVLSVDSVKEVSSGQEITLTLKISSNAPTSIGDVLVDATYPQGFDFSRAEPSPAKGQNIWSIGTLDPEDEHTIVVHGLLTGGSVEARTFNFAVGIPSERDRFSLASVFTTIQTEIQLTDPFIGLSVTVEGDSSKTVSANPDDTVDVSITFENTLSDTIYDGAIVATLSGNGLNTSNVDEGDGFFNSSARTVTWDANSVRGLRELTPGDRQTVRFSIRGADIDTTRTPEVSFSVSVSGKRVSESSVPQGLTNIESRTIRFASIASIDSRGLYSIGPFTNSGPQPPRAEDDTTYTIVLSAENGSNELADAVVSMTLPAYITWMNVVATGDTVTYNSSTREVSWRIGNVDANDSLSTAFQVSFLPSVSQVGTVPTIVGEQRLRATDRFTGTIIRATSPALTTRLSEDPNSDAQSGYVQS